MQAHRFHAAVAATVLAAMLTACGRGDTASYIASARGYLAKGDTNAAIVELKNALQATPNSGEARFLLATAFLTGGDPVSAEAEARKARDLGYPADRVLPLLANAILNQAEYRRLVAEVRVDAVKSPEAVAEVSSLLGVANLMLERPKEARALIDAALAAQSDNVNALVAKARFAVGERDFAGAMAAVDAALAKSPDDADALMLKADLLAGAGKPLEAAAIFERVAAARPGAMRPLYSLVTNYVIAKDLSKAERVVDKVKQLAPRDARTFYSIALLAIERRDVNGAAEAIRQAVQIAPDYLPARYLAGVIDLARGQYAAAEDALQTVSSRVPNDDSVRLALADTLLRRGQAEKAREVLKPSLARKPDDPAVLRAMAQVELALTNTAAAMAYFEKAAARDGNNVEGRIQLARTRMSLGDSTGGYQELAALSSLAPENRAADLALITAYLRGRDFGKALAAANALEQKHPKDPVTYNIKGIVYQAKGDFPNARASFQKALSLDPAFQAAAFNLALVDIRARDTVAARRRLEAIVAKDPRNETAYVAIAELAEKSGSAAEARGVLEKGVRANPTSVRLRMAYVNHLIRRQDPRAAVAAAQSAAEAIPQNARILEILASAQRAAGEGDQALESMQRAANLEPDNAPIALRLSAMQMQRKRYDAAIATLRSLLVRQPENWRAWGALAQAYVQGGQVNAGLSEARTMQKRFPAQGFGHALEGEIAFQQKRWAEAAAQYRLALARQPLPFAARRLHSALLEMGRTDEAGQFAAAWFKEHPGEMSLRLYLAQLDINRKDYKAAVNSLQSIVAREPDNTIALANLAWALGELRDPKAREYGEKAFALAPDDAGVADIYGWALHQTGDSARAIEMLRVALQLAPENPQYRLHLAKVMAKSGDKAAARKELSSLTGAGVPVPVRSEAEQLLKSL